MREITLFLRDTRMYQQFEKLNNNKQHIPKHLPTCSCDECARLEEKFMNKLRSNFSGQIEKFSRIEDYLKSVLIPTQYPHDLRLLHCVVNLKQELEKESEIARDKLKFLEQVKSQNRPFKSHVSAHTDKFNRSFEKPFRPVRENRAQSPGARHYQKGLTVWNNLAS